MPRHEFYCEACALVTDVLTSIHEPPGEERPCGYCGKSAQKDWSKPPNINVFKPYTEDNLGPKPVEITTARQRDELCRQHDVTYDAGRYTRPPQRDAWEKDLTLDKVADAIRNGNADAT